MTRLSIHRIKLGIILAMCILMVGLVFPMKSVVVPAASLRIVDQTGKSMPGVFVKQEWKDVTVETEMHIEVLRTDENGSVAFPARAVRSSILLRLVKGGWRLATRGFHASIGPYGTLTAFTTDDPHYWGWDGYDQTSGKWPEQIEMKHSETPIY